MTYEARYEIAGNKANARKGLTLYEAGKALEALAAAGKLTDATSVKRSGRHVAFYCAWRNEVRAMFGANDQERTALGM